MTLSDSLNCIVQAPVMDIQFNLKEYMKFNPEISTVPFCRGCVQPILDKTLLLLLPCWNQNNLQASLDGNGDEARVDKKSPRLCTRAENQENRRPLRECQDSPIVNRRWNVRGSSPTHFGNIDCYHVECLSCCECGGRLTATDRRCWKTRDYQVICRSCRIRLTHCGRCRLRVTNDVWVHKLDRLPFHIACLICSHCGRQLRQGDRCGLLGDRLLCVEHFLTATSKGDLCIRAEMGGYIEHKLLGCISDEVARSTEEEKEVSEHDGSSSHSETKSSENPNLRESGLKMNQPNHSNYPAVSKGQLGPIITEPDSTFSANCVQNRAESAMPVLITVKPDVSAGLDSWYGSDPLEQPVIPRESMSTPHGSIECALPIAEAGHSVDSSTSSGCSAHSKSKRIRTSFTPDQLAILQANFDIEANPDGQELERIANVARLNKRVTQVWFQNARARKKKIECKGIGPSNSMSFNPSIYYMQEASNSEDYFETNDEQLLTLTEQSQIMVGDSPSALLPSYASPLGAFPTTPSVAAASGTQITAPDGPCEIGAVVPFSSIHFTASNMIEQDLHPRKYLGVKMDPLGAVDRVYSILNSMKTMTTHCFPDSTVKDGQASQARGPDSINPSPPWLSLTGAQTRLGNNPNTNSDTFVGKSSNDKTSKFVDVEMQHAFSLPLGPRFIDEIPPDDSTAKRRVVTEPIRSMAVFSRV